MSLNTIIYRLTNYQSNVSAPFVYGDWDVLNNGGGMYDIAFSPELNTYIIAGAGRMILKSNDGISWSGYTEVFNENQNFSTVTWNVNQFIVIATNIFYISYDGDTWIERNSGFATSASAIVWSGTQYVACSPQGTIRTSPDGITWTARTSGITTKINSIIWSGTQYVAVGDSGRILTSPDGITWTARTSGTINTLTNIVWSGSQFVVVGFSGVILTSSNGITWAARTSGTSLNITSIEWTGTQFVVGGYDGYLAYSTNAISWTLPTPLDAGSILGVIWDGEQFLLLYQFLGILSSNLITGTKVISGATLQGGSYLEPLDLYMAVGAGGWIYTSTDSIYWKQSLTSSINRLNNVTMSSSIIVAVGALGTIQTSPDGISWTVRVSGTTSNLADVIWSGTQFVVVGVSGKILTSPDGITWTTRTSGTTNTLNAIEFNGSQYIVVGTSGTILSSTDGITWTARTSDITDSITDVIWIGTKYVCVLFNGGSTLTSSDGINWSSVSGVIAVRKIIWDGSQLVGVGQLGTLATSPETINWTVEHTYGSRLHPTTDPIVWENILNIFNSPSRIIAVGDYGMIIINPVS